MTAPYTSAEHALAAKLYAEFVGYDLAHRLPLRCRGPWMQRQWLAVARLAATLLGDEATVAGLIVEDVVRVGFQDPPLAIPSPPIGATAVLR
jgi:hypothetical protein